MILSAATLRRLKPVWPFVERTIFNGMSFGLSSAGYDIRIAQDNILGPNEFRLGSSVERISLPNNVMAFLTDKSSFARRGLSCFNCVLEPGWSGHLTIEMKNQSWETINIPAGSPIAQIIFQYVDDQTEGYSGKYQFQGPQPQCAIFER